MANRKTIAQQTAVAAVERTLPVAAESVHYPDSDGHFLPDNPLQAHAVINVRFALQEHFGEVDNVVLEGDMFMYYEEGNPAASIAPDVYVVLDHDLGKRGVYKFWEEGKPPDFALEVISPSSTIRNAKEKRVLYAQLGIGEYFLFQPDPSKRGRRLVGYQLWGDAYEPVPPEPDDAVCSEALGVSFRVEGENLRLRNLATGQDYPWMEENSRNVKAIRAENEAFRAQNEAFRAENEAVRAENEVFRARADADAETQRQAEMRIAELEALLAKRG